MKKDRSLLITILIVLAAGLIALAAMLYRPAKKIIAPSAGKLTNQPSPTRQWMVTATPGAADESTPVPTSAQISPTSGTVSPTNTEAPKATDIPVVSGTPEITDTLAITDTPAITGTPAVTLKPTVSPKPTTKPTPTATAKPTPTSAGSNAKTGGYYGQLKVTGAHLTDGSGKSVQLRGVSTHGLGWYPQYVNKNAFSEYQRWGANVVRLAMYTEEYNGYCSSGTEQKNALKKLIDDGVQFAKELDMYVIIDWHILSDNNPNTHKNEAKVFFDDMSKKYAKDPHVIYEICNEPNGSTTWTDIKKYAEEIIPVIKKNSPDAVIIVGTPTWSQDVDQAAKSPITGYSNIMYALHFYAATHKDNLRSKCKNASSKGLPVFVSEFGICDASGNGSIDEAEANKWISLLNELGISYVNWSLSNKAESASVFNSNCNKTSGFTQDDLTKSGKWLVKTLGGKGADSYIIPTSTPAPTATPEPTRAPGVSATPVPQPTQAVGPEQKYSVDDFIEKTGENVSFKVNGPWENKIQLIITVSNPKSSVENNWERIIYLKQGAKLSIVNSWNATVSLSGNKVIITPPSGYNGSIPANGSLTDIGLELLLE